MRIKLSFFILLLIATPSRAGLIFEQNWEDGGTGNTSSGFRPVQYCCDHSITNVTTRAHEGQHSLHSVVYSGDRSVDGHTSRAMSSVLPGTSINGKAVLPYDRDRWFGFSLYVPRNSDMKLMYLFSTHAYNWGGGACNNGSASSPISLRIEGPGYEWGDGNYHWRIATYPDYTNGAGTGNLPSSALARVNANNDVDRWVNFVFHINLSHGSGTLKVWKDGESIYSNHNFTLADYPVPQYCGHFYPKIGTGNSGKAFYPLETYHDSIRWGDEHSSYAEVDPARGGAPAPPAPTDSNPPQPTDSTPPPPTDSNKKSTLPFLLLFSSQLHIPSH